MKKNIGPASSQQEQDREQTGKQEKEKREKKQDPVPLFVILSTCGPVPVSERWEHQGYVAVAYWLLENGWEVNAKERTETLTEAVRYPLAMWADVMKRLQAAEAKGDDITNRCGWIRGVAKSVYKSWSESIGARKPGTHSAHSPRARNGAPHSVRPCEPSPGHGPVAPGGRNGGSGRTSGTNGRAQAGGVLGAILSDLEKRRCPRDLDGTGTTDRAPRDSNAKVFNKWCRVFEAVNPKRAGKIVREIEGTLEGVPYRDGVTLGQVRYEQRLREIWLAEVAAENHQGVKNQDGEQSRDAEEDCQ